MNWMYFTIAGTYLLGMLTGYLNRAFGMLFMTIRIPPESAFQVYEKIKKESRWKFCLNDSLEPTGAYSLPATESAISYIGGMWIYTDVTEKYLTAGHVGKEIHYHISYLRFNRRSLINFLKDACKKQGIERESITVYSTNWNWFVPVSELRKKAVKPPKLATVAQEKIDGLLADFKAGKKDRAGILLYGPPGNGKTSLIRYIAASNDWDIYIPLIKPESTNEDIIRMFMNIPKKDKCVIIFEDFDNVFERRWPRNSQAKYSFDVVLNILDGLYADLTNKLIVITTNYLEAVDDAIKNRPSRMDLCLELGNPDLATRQELVGDTTLAVAMDGLSYSTVQELVRRGTSLADIKVEGAKLEHAQANSGPSVGTAYTQKTVGNIYVALPVKPKKLL